EPPWPDLLPEVSPLLHFHTTARELPASPGCTPRATTPSTSRSRSPRTGGSGRGSRDPRTPCRRPRTPPAGRATPRCAGRAESGWRSGCPRSRALGVSLQTLRGHRDVVLDHDPLAGSLEALLTVVLLGVGPAVVEGGDGVEIGRAHV